MRASVPADSHILWCVRAEHQQVRASIDTGGDMGVTRGGTGVDWRGVVNASMQGHCAPCDL
jgi:hypothetical protein